MQILLHPKVYAPNSAANHDDDESVVQSSLTGKAPLDRGSEDVEDNDTVEEEQSQALMSHMTEAS